MLNTSVSLGRNRVCRVLAKSTRVSVAPIAPFRNRLTRGSRGPLHQRLVPRYEFELVLSPSASGNGLFKERCQPGTRKTGTQVDRKGSSMVCHATPLGGNDDMSHEEDTVKLVEDRISRLEVALTLRKLYRNLLRADLLLQFPSPIYKAEELETEVADATSSTDPSEAAIAAQKKIDEAIDFVAELELTAEELRTVLSTLRNQISDLASIFPEEDSTKTAVLIKDYVKSTYRKLVDRLTEELPFLPFPSVTAAQAEIELRNAKFRSSPLPGFGADLGYQSDTEYGMENGTEQRRGLSERLGEAERVAERFVSRKLQPAVARVRKTSPEGFIQGFQQSASWARGLWDRLNGATDDAGAAAVAAILPLPFPTKKSENSTIIEKLHTEINELESKLQEASKVRENRVRKADIQSRAKVAAELRKLDDDVTTVSRELAIRTLQLEMESIYDCLENEVMDIIGDPSATVGEQSKDRLSLALSRRGSTDEIALLTAEYKQLATSLSSMVTSVEAREALYIDDGELAALATEIPDLRIRLGLGDDVVFGTSGFSLGKIQFQIKQAINKLREAITFGGRGVRLLGADIGSAGRLFWRALLGGTLKPREVAALRRTARDLLTFIPFIIILILPLTPVGHVLIFGFLQRYFPGFFPSQFTSRRQDLMIKYEQLKKQLSEAQLQAEAENDELEFRKMAAAAEAILSQKPMGQSSAVSMQSAAQQLASSVGMGGSSSSEEPSEEEDFLESGPAAEAVRELEKKLAAAADSSYTEVDENAGDAENE